MIYTSSYHPNLTLLPKTVWDFSVKNIKKNFRYDINSITDDVKVVTSFNNILKRILRFLNGTEETYE
ncbi:hypothetical protein CVS40_8999 [Lucilia cuprina]|nr:hypothetical protein CVS40_8999 [Lucilia cuprina]